MTVQVDGPANRLDRKAAYLHFMYYSSFLDLLSFLRFCERKSTINCLSKLHHSREEPHGILLGKEHGHRVLRLAWSQFLGLGVLALCARRVDVARQAPKTRRQQLCSWPHADGDVRCSYRSDLHGDARCRVL